MFDSLRCNTLTQMTDALNDLEKEFSVVSFSLSHDGAYYICLVQYENPVEISVDFSVEKSVDNSVKAEAEKDLPGLKVAHHRSFCSPEYCGESVDPRFERAGD